MTYVQTEARVRTTETRHREHPSLAIQLCNIGAELYEQGDYDGAMKHHWRALVTLRRALGPDHDSVAYPLTALGRLFIRQGALKAALRTLECALEIRESALGPDHPAVAETLLSLGELALARQQSQRAVEMVERALELGNEGAAPALWFVLAQALWARNQAEDRHRAIQAAAASHAVYAARSDHAQCNDVESWLHAHQI